MKKLLGLLLVAVMCVGLFAACGEAGKKDDTTAAQTTNPVADTSDTTAAPVAVTEDTAKIKALSDSVKAYIKDGQSDIPEVGRLKWSARFLEAADLSSVLSEYLKNGGKSDDVKAAAEYVTENAPVSENWKDLFVKDFSEEYKDETITKYEDLGSNSYSVYVNKDGKEVAFVTVNAATGYYHG